jgi:hypothetical protein
MKTILSTIFSSLVLFSAAQNSNCNTIPAGTDFGLCQMIVGIAHVENQGCVTVGGCGYIAADGTDYSDYFFDNPADCEAACLDACPEIPLSADFGECDMALGAAMLEGGQCTFLSGCGYTANDGVDYSTYFFDSIEECDAACFGTQVCVDSAQIDMSIACLNIWLPVCGCNNVTYGNECEAYNWGGVTSWTEGECALNVEETENFTATVFPNPAADEIRIQIDSTKAISYYQVYSQDGRLVLEGKYTGQVVVSTLAKGTYIFKAGFGKNELPYTAIFSKF